MSAIGEQEVLDNCGALVDLHACTLSGRVVYFDITGLGHSTWVPLVKVFLDQEVELRVVYLEPSSYTLSPTPRAGELYDLSERIQGIRPLPLVTVLDEPPVEDILFVPFLGFEGTRFSHMLEEIQPFDRKTIPVIGAPGFRPEYPFKSYIGNAGPLARSGGNRLVRYAKSNCPFSAFYVLDDIFKRYPKAHIKIGLIGTKPHALGATLFFLAKGDRVELVYDHVKRKKNRTKGFDRCLVYNVAEFFAERAVAI
ncbi:hypothetical protein [Pelagibacterium luteolum]|uniref:Uncharacterized protein n=1 Tax=Pelagibacterium luteolum TaxID=440168 RepID=A0A1G7Y5V0_9HYPH|nr:hypothetical protein [Pelagibacterium luteolum]SDG91848.1 hypothetical protein SAMN04487974_11275 [Pelagibacterium luteolum]